jgi:hypothetical protein
MPRRLVKDPFGGVCGDIPVGVIKGGCPAGGSVLSPRGPAQDQFFCFPFVDLQVKLQELVQPVSCLPCMTRPS